jgi:hypothetical protein
MRCSNLHQNRHFHPLIRSLVVKDCGFFRFYALVFYFLFDNQGFVEVHPLDPNATWIK